MDVIEFLIEDHNRLRKELERIGENLSENGLKESLRAFVSHYDFHESVENEILSSEKANGDVHGYKWIHSGAHSLLKDLQGFVESQHPVYIQRAFSNFQVLTQSHFEYEKNTIFPILRKLLDEKTLDDLGHKAEERLNEMDKKASP